MAVNMLFIGNIKLFVENHTGIAVWVYVRPLHPQDETLQISFLPPKWTRLWHLYFYCTYLLNWVKEEKSGAVLGEKKEGKKRENEGEEWEVKVKGGDVRWTADREKMEKRRKTEEEESDGWMCVCVSVGERRVVYRGRGVQGRH